MHIYIRLNVALSRMKAKVVNYKVLKIKHNLDTGRHTHREREKRERKQAGGRAREIIYMDVCSI